MTSSMTRTLTSALFGGGAAFFFAPALFPAVVYLHQGAISSSIVFALLAIAFFALVVGLVFGLFVGFPLLALFNRLQWNEPVFIAGAAALASVLVLSKGFSLPASAWPLYGYYLILGGLCGAVAALHNRR